MDVVPILALYMARSVKKWRSNHVYNLVVLCDNVSLSDFKDKLQCQTPNIRSLCPNFVRFSRENGQLCPVLGVRLLMHPNGGHITSCPDWTLEI